MDQTGSQVGLLTGAEQGVTTANVLSEDDQEGKTVDLQEGITIVGFNTVSAARSLEVDQQAAAELSDGWSQPILFYPDGTTSTAVVTLQHENSLKVMIKLRGITGDATLTEVMP